MAKFLLEASPLVKPFSTNASLGATKEDTNAQKMKIFAKKMDKSEEAEQTARIEKTKSEEAAAKKSQKNDRKKIDYCNFFSF